jgi:phosphoenolpyruvate carboxylase
MATQHPDNAGAPWWKKENAFINTQDEIDEMVLLFEQLPIDEYMWDWEGKYVDEAVGEKLFSRAQELLKKRPLGQDLHLTYRIPAFDGTKMHRMARAFMNVLSLADLARDVGYARPPVTEMFLPLTTSADQPIKVREVFRKIARYHADIFHENAKKDAEILKMFEVTPLVEDSQSLLHIESIIDPYWASLKKEKKDLSRGQRVFLARSDPAMNAGLLPAVLAIKVALSTLNEIAGNYDIDVHPVIGTGSLPFRGSVNPLYTEPFLTQYAGVRTYTIQSAFRYDYEIKDVKKALATIKREAPKRTAMKVSATDKKRIIELCKTFGALWKPTIEALAPLINDVARFVPPRRERIQHIGLFGYSRGVGKVRLPRAIGFTAALYSVGLPPELIATGRGLAYAEKNGQLDLVKKYYPALKDDLEHAGKYFNRENVEILAKSKPVFREIQKDIDAIERIVGVELGPKKPHHIVHRNLSSNILNRLRDTKASKESLTRDIVEAGIVRRSLG